MFILTTGAVAMIVLVVVMVVGSVSVSDGEEGENWIS